MAMFTADEKGKIRKSFREEYGMDVGKIQILYICDLGITFAIMYADSFIGVTPLFLNTKSPGTDKDARLSAANLFLEGEYRMFLQMPERLKQLLNKAEEA